MTYLRASFLVMFLIISGLFAGHTTVVKKGDSTYKELQMDVDYKESKEDKNTISVTVKMLASGADIYLVSKDKGTKIKPTIKDKFAYFNFDIDKATLDKSQLRWADLKSRTNCPSYIQIDIKDMIVMQGKK